MKISNVSNSSFGRLYLRNLSSSDRKLIRPVYEELKSLGKRADVILISSTKTYLRDGRKYKAPVVNVIASGINDFEHAMQRQINLKRSIHPAKDILSTARRLAAKSNGLVY